MEPISMYVTERGPTRSSELAEHLVNNLMLSPDAARKRLSRIRPPLRKFPVQLLPKREHFIYLQSQRTEERFWTNFHSALRNSQSIFGASLDGLLARGGSVTEEEFKVISGGTATKIKGQLLASSIAERLIAASVVARRKELDGSTSLYISRGELFSPGVDGTKGRDLTEKIVMDAFREWARRLGLASYNQIRIRGEDERKPVGPFMFDVAGPCYLLPLRKTTKQPGFLVADVFAGTIINEHHLDYFIRKVTTLHAFLGRQGAGVFAVMIADGFTGSALKKGHAAGIVLATPKDLFGRRVGQGLQMLLQTLQNAAAYASSETPDRLIKLLDDLSEVEGAAGNVRGILFELLSAYLVRRGATSIDMGIRAYDSASGASADIDILKITNQASDCTVIECKGKIPGGTLTLEEAQNWIRKLPIFQSHLRARPDLREANLSFELWTSGSINSDALEYLQKERARRTKTRISWRDGNEVIALAHIGKEKAIANALNEHFLKHPLSEVNKTEFAVSAAAIPALQSSTAVGTSIAVIPHTGFLTSDFLPD